MAWEVLGPWAEMASRRRRRAGVAHQPHGKPMSAQGPEGEPGLVKTGIDRGVAHTMKHSVMANSRYLMNFCSGCTPSTRRAG